MSRIAIAPALFFMPVENAANEGGNKKPARLRAGKGLFKAEYQR